MQEVLELINSIVEKKEKIKLEQISFQKGKLRRENISTKLLYEKQSPSAVSNIEEKNICSKENNNEIIWEHSYISPTFLSNNSDIKNQVDKPHQEKSSMLKNDVSTSVSTNVEEIKESQQNIQGM